MRVAVFLCAVTGLSACQTASPYAVPTPTACMALDRWIGARGGDAPVTFDTRMTDATMAETRLRTELGPTRGYRQFEQLETCVSGRTGAYDYERAEAPIALTRERGGVLVGLRWDPAREATTVTLERLSPNP